MGMMMAVSFERYGRLYYLDPGGHQPKIGDKVLVPTDGGPEVAECVWAPQWLSEDVGGLPVCAGLAGPEDLERDDQNRRRRAEGRLAARRLIREHGLPMKLIAVDFLSATNVFVVYFSAPHRVDFRLLVRDLAARLRSRVELQQIGPRDEARLQGGIGPCGRDLCCATFLKDFEPVSVRMAKDEHPLYQDFKKKAPRAGTQVETPDGPGTVVAHSVPSDSVVVKLAADGSTCACSVASVCGSRKAYDATYGPD
jgi:cell fate regulator YaaT (PSP1 superfamily)